MQCRLRCVSFGVVADFISFAFYSIVKAPVVCDACKDDLCIRLLALVFMLLIERPAGL